MSKKEQDDETAFNDSLIELSQTCPLTINFIINYCKNNSLPLPKSFIMDIDYYLLTSEECSNCNISPSIMTIIDLCNWCDLCDSCYFNKLKDTKDLFF